MKVVRDKSVWGTLSRVLGSPGGIDALEYISLTRLEAEELETEYGVVFNDGCTVMSTDSWGLDDLYVAVRIESQDKYSRARRKIVGDGRVQTR